MWLLPDTWNKSVPARTMCNVTSIPTTLTSEVVLPRYQHFLQHIHQTGMTKKVSNESDSLGQYGKTIQMLILARVNGHYSPYSPQTIMEEKAKSRYGDVFTLAEKEFFKHRLLLYFLISQKKVLKHPLPS